MSTRLKNDRSDYCVSLGGMGSLLRKLDELLQSDGEKSIILLNFKKDVESIYTKLKELSEVYDPPLTVNCWMKDVRELSYNMADFFKGLADARDAEAKVDEISEFEALVEDVTELYHCYDLEKYINHVPKTVIRHRLGWPCAVMTELVGMDDTIKKLRSLVESKSDEDKQPKVISILGVDYGVGRSTLARKLWHELGTEFGACRALVLMARKPDMRMILRSILSQVRPHEPPGKYTVSSLIHDIRRHLQDKRYFIVIDDLLDISVWDIVRRAFPYGKSCSRIIITTTVEEVAHTCCGDYCDIVNIKPLSDKQPYQLFLNGVVGTGKKCPEELNVVLDEITRKCGGLPLAITCIAALVSSEQQIKQKHSLEKMQQQFFMEATVPKKLDYVKNFLDNNLKTRATSTEILNVVLKLCYSSLPHCLKTCLLYLSMYPENYLIQKEDLVKQWIAEGFIVDVERQTTAKIAGSYFDILVSLGLIQRMDGHYTKQQHLRNGEESLLHSYRVTYVVHPMVFEFVTAKSMEYNFITIIDYSQSKVVITERTHRLSLHFGSATYAATPTSIRLSQVRSLAFMGLFDCMPSLHDFEVVQVIILHVQSDHDEIKLKEICELRLLRYLQVRCNVTVKLPGEVQCLKHLETLEIDAEVKYVPSDIVQHSSLQHVRIGRKTQHQILGQGPITFTKPIFLENLGSKPLPAVQVFELLPPICIFSRLPGWISLLKVLRILEVVVRELGTFDLDHLGKLPKLIVLSLYVQKPATQRTTFHISTSPFAALEYFKFVSGEMSLNFPEKGMPKLQRLKIRFNARRVDKYSDMLRSIHHLENLQEVVARIGTANGDEDGDFRKAVESAFERAIQEVEKLRSSSQIRHNVKWVDKVDEEYDPSGPSKNQGEISEEIQNEESTEQRDGKVRTADRKQTPLPPVKDDAAPTSSQNKIRWRYGQASYENSRYLHLLPGAVNVLEKLRVLLQEEHVLLWHIAHHIKHLRSELSQLCDDICGRVREPRNLRFQAMQWFNRYCDLAYDIEDWADLLALRIRVDDFSRVKSSSWIPQFLHHAVDMLTTQLTRNTIFYKIKDLQVRLTCLRDYAPYPNIYIEQPIKFEPQEIMPHNRPPQLVGHKRPMDEVINMLMNASNVAKFKIISIVGMAGSGKTTLAEAVYERLKGEFDRFVFFSVGHQGTIETTLEGMLRKVEMKEQESKNIQQNITKLRKLLGTNRYLIVLDDLWRMEDWEVIKNVFPTDNLHSRIIITTRNDTLAFHCCSRLTDCIYKIGLLSNADSKQLFRNEVFRTGHSCLENLENVSAQILKKCGGLPLAIVTAASRLKHFASETLGREIGLIISSSSCSRLNLSYNDLPTNLKSCILYLSMFPEYYEISVERLMRLWIAEGFIIEENRRALEETAGSYLDGLISRNMVLPLHVNHHGIPKYCMVHPVIHDFIVQKAMEEKFIAILNDQHQDVAKNYGTIHRLSIQRTSKHDQNVAQDSSMDLSHVRSIIVIGPANTVPCLTDLSLVRILDLEGCDGMARFLHGLHKLPLLRYLSLRGTDVRELPKEIEESSFLQTLDVRSTNVKMLPIGIVRLERLTHVLCGRARLPHKISKMNGLRTLSCDFAKDRSYIGIGNIGVISKLVNLMELELFCDFTQIPTAEKHVTFPEGGFQSLKKLCIRCNSASVTFEPKILPTVEELELSFEGILGEESIGVSGIEHLLSLKHVHLEFDQKNASTMAIVDAVRKAASAVHPNYPDVTVNEVMRSIDRTVN